MIVTAHQPNFLPGMSVIEKVREADAVIWLDEVQYSHDGWSNRNKMPDGSWLTVPVERRTDMGPFNRVRIAQHGDWRAKACKTLSQHYGLDATFDIQRQIHRPYKLLIGLNLALLRILLQGCETEWHFQSHLDGGHQVWATGDDSYQLAPISQRLAMMVRELGGSTYLSGPSGKNYLDESYFVEAGVKVEYFQWDGENPCAVGSMAHV